MYKIALKEHILVHSKLVSEQRDRFLFVRHQSDSEQAIQYSLRDSLVIGY